MIRSSRFQLILVPSRIQCTRVFLEDFACDHDSSSLVTVTLEMAAFIFDFVAIFYIIFLCLFISYMYLIEAHTSNLVTEL